MLAGAKPGRWPNFVTLWPCMSVSPVAGSRREAPTLPDQGNEGGELRLQVLQSALFADDGARVCFGNRAWDRHFGFLRPAEPRDLARRTSGDIGYDCMSRLRGL
ncbi:MAG: hypothetical protein EBY18_14450 [Alphaproteobacteria bacterium]|nr:hypothetical protein [Alphaproteobacteria bacterium]